MRILHLCNRIAGNYFPDLSAGLVTAGHEVVLAALQAQDEPEWIHQAPGVSFVSLNASTRWQYPCAVLRLSKIIRTMQVDVVHAHLFDAGMVGIAAARLAGKPVVHHRHYGDLHELLKKPLHLGVDKLLEQTADRVMVVAQHVKDYLIRHDRIPAGKIDCVPLGVDTEKFSFSPEARTRIRLEFGLTDEFVVGNVASFQPIKGHVYLLEAVAELAKQIPGIRLLLVGSGHRAPIDAAILRLGIERNVIFAGFRRDVPECLSALDVMVHPSVTEALCQAVLEGMAVGLPIIGTDIPFVHEVIADDVNGRIVPVADPAAIARAVVGLYADADGRQRLGAAARQTILSRFTIGDMVAGHIACYRQVLKTSAHRGSAS
jgi:glycosyltransferase involved in cell wall biosynthesis